MNIGNNVFAEWKALTALTFLKQEDLGCVNYNPPLLKLGEKNFWKPKVEYIIVILK